MAFADDNLSFDSSPLGLHRVCDSPKVLPQNALKLDVSQPLVATEVLVDVDFLQIDSASFHQLKKEFSDEEGLKKQVMAIVAQRGKMQNPVTGSGGMLLGRISEVGTAYPDKTLKSGQKIATLISLTATPLKLTSIEFVDFARERLKVKGQAILFERSLYASLPEGISQGAALAAFDICGAPKLVLNHVKRGDAVFVLGLGKAGRSVIAAVQKEFANDAAIFGADASGQAVDFCKKNYGQGQRYFSTINAADSVAVMNWVESVSAKKMADVTINLVNVPNTEMSSILATRDGGRCLFFSMATDFQKATLGAESAAKDVMLVMGSGYTPGHAAYMVELLRADKILLDYFEREFGL